MTKSIIVLDDEFERHGLFEKIIGRCFDSVYSAETLLKEIDKGIVATTLFLDHDLGSNMDGTGFVKALRERQVLLPTVTRIFVHSNNVSKNEPMARDLQSLYPNIIVKVAPMTQLNDMWSEFHRDKEALKYYLLTIQ